MEQMEQEQEIRNLELQLNEAIAAENFFETASGKLASDLATKEIDRLIKDICSDKYLHDHMGYVVAVTQLQARRDWLKRLQLAKSPKRVAKIKERLAQYGQSE